MTRPTSFFPGALALALALASAAAVRPGEATAQEPPDSVVRLEPVVVRILRSAVGLGTPFPVSVVAGDELTRGHAGAYLEEALRALPGVQIQNRFNLASGERLSVRGFGSRAQFGIRGIRVLLDGIPATLPDGQTALDHLDPSSLGRAELMRGPGSALYGNAAGGVLHLETRPPATHPEAALSAAAGADGLRTLSAGVSGPIGRAGLRVGVSRYRYDGFRRDPVADDGSVYGRQERTVVTASAVAPLWGGRLRLSANGLDMAAANPGSLSRALMDQGDRQAFRTNVLQRTREDVRQGQAGVAWSGPLGPFAMETAAWVVRRDFQGWIPSDLVTFDRKAGGVRSALTVPGAVGEMKFFWAAGVELEVQSDDRRNWGNQRGERGGVRLDQQERVTGAGLFTQLRFEPAPTVSVAGGLRHDWNRFRADDRFLADGTDDSGRRVMQELSPSLGILWQAGREVEIFASFATAFETPTTTELANRPEGAGGFNPSLDATRSLTVEGGFRARWGRSWVAETALFRTDLRNELVPFQVPEVPGRTFFRNAGESYRRGGEVTVEGRPTAHTWVRAAYTRVDARFSEYAVGGTDHSGNRIPGLAPHRLDGRAAWESAWGFLELRGLLQSAVSVDDANSAESPGSVVVDVRAGLRSVRWGAVRAAPFVAVNNVLDRRYDASVVVNAFGGRYFEPGPGRNLQAGAAITVGGGRQR